jgi:hypothetical protein
VGHFENVYCRTFAERQARAIFRTVRFFRKSVGHHRSGDLWKHYSSSSFVWQHCQSVGDGIIAADGAPWHFLFAESKAAGACRAGKLTGDFVGACRLSAIGKTLFSYRQRSYTLGQIIIKRHTVSSRNLPEISRIKEKESVSAKVVRSPFL